MTLAGTLAVKGGPRKPGRLDGFRTGRAPTSPSFDLSKRGQAFQNSAVPMREERGVSVKWYGILLGAILGTLVGTVIGYLLVPAMLK